MIDAALADAGLTLQGVLTTAALADPPAAAEGYESLMVFAHVGSAFWRNLPENDSPDPLDSHARQLVEGSLAQRGISDYRILYPASDINLDLMALGRELGWQHPSLLGIGINQVAGTWFAYRVVVAVNPGFPASAPLPGEPPCDACTGKPCIAACPSGAVTENGFSLETCTRYRMKDHSRCADQCLARIACPVSSEHQYDEAQMRYHYGRSLVTIKRYSRNS